MALPSRRCLNGLGLARGHGIAALLIAATPGPAADAAQQPRCPLTLSAQMEVVASVDDGETLTLESGRRIRLIGALAPRVSDAPAAARVLQPLAQETKRWLEQTLLGRVVQTAAAIPQTDRYGRELAHVFLATEQSITWIQGELLKRGLARAYGLPGSFACASELAAHERLARAHRSGLWATSIYEAKLATEPDRLILSRSRYELVTGAVTAIAKTKGATYVNFGHDYRSDTTLKIGDSVRSAHPDFAEALENLQGKTVLARGWIERRNGPMIEISDPSQIEVEPTVDSDAELIEPILTPAAPETPEKSPGPREKPPGVNL